MKMQMSRSPHWMILLIIILVGLIGTLFWHFSRIEATAATGIVIVMLTALNGLLMLTLIFVIARSLIRLYIGRKNKVKGIRIKTKLVLAVLPISLVPAAMMYFFSTQILSRTLQKLAIDANVSTVIEEAYELNKNYAERMAATFRPVASMLDTPMSQREDEPVREILDGFQLSGAEIYKGGTLDYSVYSKTLSNEKQERIERTRRWSDQVSPELFDDGWIIWRFPYSSAGKNMVLVMTMDTPFSERWAFLADSYKFLNHAKRKRESVSSAYQTTLLIITFAVVFAGIWLGGLFSKSLMRSLNILIQGTDAVAKGNFETSISLNTGDELEDLGQAFNSMIGELKQYRQELQAKAAALENVNQRLSVQYEYTETLIKEVNAGILSCDLDGTVRTCNPAAKRLLTGTPKNILDLESSKGLNSLVTCWEKYHMHGSRPFTEQVEWRIGKGQLNVAVTLTPIKSGEAALGTLIVLEDLTSLFNAQKLAAWREVARRVAHEIKNPLTPLQLSIQRIYRKSLNKAEDLDKVIESGYETITSEIKLLEKLVNEFSHFAKLPAPSKKDFDLVALLRNSQETYRDVFLPIELKLESQVQELTIHGDPSQVRQVLGNLIRNAATASEMKGTITLSLLREGPLAILKVMDEGHGIPDDEKLKVFVPYYSKAPKGTGLGLAIVQRIVHDHGWQISVLDNQPKGSVFALQIPLMNQDGSALMVNS